MQHMDSPLFKKSLFTKLIPINTHLFGFCLWCPSEKCNFLPDSVFFDLMLHQGGEAF